MICREVSCYVIGVYVAHTEINAVTIEVRTSAMEWMMALMPVPSAKTEPCVSESKRRLLWRL